MGHTHDGNILLHVLSEITRLVPRRMCELATPLEHQGQLCELAGLTRLLLGIDGLELRLGAWKVDLAEQSIIELRELGEIFAISTQTLGLLDGSSDEVKLIAFAKDDFLAFAIEKGDEGLRPPLADGEVELELLLRCPICVPKDGNICFEEPRRFFRLCCREWSFRRGSDLEAERRKDFGRLVCGEWR